MSSSGVMGAPSNEASQTTVLVVEDEVLIRADLADQLRDGGYAVIEAANGSEALDIIHSNIPLHFVITDRHMPGPLDGIGLARQMQAEFPSLKVIMVSADRPDTCDCIYAFFAKPCDTSVLIEFLSTLRSAAGGP